MKKLSRQEAVYPIWLVVVISYATLSFYLKGPLFELFDLIWRSLIIVGCVFLGKQKLRFSSTQWLGVIAVFSLSFTLAFALSGITSLREILILIALAPLAEELFFRGYVLERVGQRPSEKLMLTSILFGLYHLKNLMLLSPVGLICQVLYAALIIGPILCLARLKTKSLFWPIVLHSFNNLIGVTITPFLIRLYFA